MTVFYNPPEVGHHLHHRVQQGDVVVGSGERLEGRHQVEAGQVVTVAAGDVEALEAVCHGLTCPRVHHKMFSRPQQLPVNMELLQRLVLHQPLQHLDLVPGEVELPQLLELIKAAHPGDLVVLEVEELDVRCGLQSLAMSKLTELAADKTDLTSIHFSLLLYRYKTVRFAQLVRSEILVMP